MKELKRKQLFARTVEHLREQGYTAQVDPEYRDPRGHGQGVPALVTGASSLAAGWYLAQACEDLGGDPDVASTWISELRVRVQGHCKVLF